MDRFEVRRVGQTKPVYRAYAPDRYMEIQTSVGEFSVKPGDIVIEVAAGRVYIVPAALFGRAWVRVGSRDDRPAVEQRPPAPAAPALAADTDDEEDFGEPEDSDPALADEGDTALWEKSFADLTQIAIGYQISLKGKRSKKALIDAIKAVERG